MIKVSVIIPTFQRCSSVKRSLKALSSQTFSHNEFEVIVSIDGSTDGTKEMVEGFAAPYTLSHIWEPNTGRASARNRGIYKAKGEVIIFIDDDMEPSPELVRAHYSSHLSERGVGVMGASPILLDQTSNLATRYIGTEFNNRLNKMSQSDYKFRLWDFTICNFSIPRKVILDFNGLDESFNNYGHEDLELAVRLNRAGVKIVYNPDALCRQHYEDNLRGLVKKAISSGKNAVLLFNKHPHTFSELDLTTYNSNGWKWRSLRLFLIWSSMLIPGVNDIVIFSLNLVKTKNPRIQNKLCYLAIDYSFWLGVWTALRSDKNKNEIKAKIKSYRVR